MTLSYLLTSQGLLEEESPSEEKIKVLLFTSSPLIFSNVLGDIKNCVPSVSALSVFLHLQRNVNQFLPTQI